VCGQRFQTGINCKPVTYLTASTALTLCTADLSAAVDVYSDWVDACDAVAKDAANKYEERDTRGMRLNEYPVSYESQETGAITSESRKNEADDF